MSEKTYTANDLYHRTNWEEDCYELYAEGLCAEDIEDPDLAEAWVDLCSAYDNMHFYQEEFMRALEEARDRQMRPYADEKYHFPTADCE